MNRTQQAILIVKESLEPFENLTGCWHIDYFKQACYSKWTAQELIQLLIDNPDAPPSLLVRQFTDKMDRYSVVDAPNTIMFSIAKDFSENIEDVLRAMSPY